MPARLARYAPFGVLATVSIATGLAIALGFGGAVGMSLHAIVGFMLCALALLRFLELAAFADAFRRYDLIARRWRPYGLAYPFLQFGLGLCYFSFFAPVQTYFASALLLTFTLAGALSAIETGRARSVAAASLRAPSAVMMLMESGVLAVMALVMLWM